MFGLLGDILSLPVRAVVDVVELPARVMNGEDLFEHTAKGFEDIDKELRS